MRFRALSGALLFTGLWATSAGAATLPPAANAGIAWLQSQLNADGSLKNENLSIATPLQARSESATALGAAGTAPASLTGAIAVDTGNDTESLARHIQALLQANQDPVAQIQLLLANQNSDGGFGDYPSYPSTILDTAYALQVLIAAGQSSADPAHNAALFLQGKQAADGSWSDWQGTDTAYSTALVISALSPYSAQLASMGSAIKNGGAYLSSQRQAGTDWNESFIDAEVILALSVGNGDPSLISLTASDLTKTQAGDGSWSEDPYVTALAVRALVAAAADVPATQLLGTAQGYVVESGTGRPLAGASVFLASNPQTVTTTNSSGYFDLGGLPVGQITLVGRAPGYGVASIVVTASSSPTTQTSQLVLGQNTGTGMVFGQISSQQSGTALAGATVQLSGSTSYTVTTAADGSFSISTVSPGSYTLQISASGFITVSSAAAVTAGGQLEVDQSLLLTGTYQNASPVTVTASIVDGTTGAPIAGARLALSTTDSAAADGSGSVSLANTPVGSYQATVSAAGYVTAVYAVTLSPGSNGQLGTLSVYPASAVAANTLTILATVTDGLTNKPIAGATVTRTDTGTTWTTGADGTVSLSGLNVLSVILQVAATGYGAQQFTVSASGFGQVAQTLVLPASGGSMTATMVTLAGTVTDAATGTPVGNAAVALSGTTSAAVVNTGSNGQYQLPNIGSTGFNLQVSATGYVTQTIPVSLAQFGNYPLNIQLTPTAPGSSLQVVSVNARSAILSATDTGVFTAVVGNTGSSDMSAYLFAEVTDEQGNAVSNVGGKLPGSSNLMPSFTVPATGQVSAEFDWAPEQLAAGGYTVTVYAITPGSVSRTVPHGTILAQGSVVVSVSAGEAMTGQLAFSPPLSQAGSTTPVAISALVINSGNVTIASLPLHLTVKDPATGNVIYSADTQATQLPVNNNVTLQFGSWAPTTTGNLKVHLASTDPSIAGVIDGTLYVGNKATGQFSVDRSIVAPGNNTVHAKVAMQGIDITRVSNADPLYYAVQRAVTNGGAYVGPNAEAWQNSNQCVSCHVQSQSLIGLASSLNKATINAHDLNFVANALATSHQNDGTLHDAYPQYVQTQTTLNLRALNKLQDHGELYGEKLAAAMFLHQQRIVSGANTSWNLDYIDQGWWRQSKDELTALIVKDFTDVVQAASAVDTTQVVSYSLQPLTPANSFAHPWSIKTGPDGRLYVMQQNGTIWWKDPVSGATGAIVVSGLPNTAYGIVPNADGSFYISGVGFLARLPAGQTKATIISQNNGEYISDIAVSPVTGLIYGVDVIFGRLLRFNGSAMTILLNSQTLDHPRSLAFDDAGNLMIADWGHSDLIEYSANGTVSQWAWGMDLKPLWIAYDHQGGWYVSTDNMAFDSSFPVYHCTADAVCQNLARVNGPDNIAGMTVLNGMPVTIDLTQNSLLTLTAQPVDVTTDLNLLRQDIAGGAQYLLGTYQDGNPNMPVQALRLWGMGEARKTVTAPTLLNSLNQAVSYLDTSLRAQQRPDGGFNALMNNKTLASDALATAMVGLALDYSQPSSQDPVIRNSIQFLLNNQAGDGSWISADRLMTTKLNATSFVMDYLPEALTNLGGVDVDLYVGDTPEASLGNLNPAPYDITVGSTGTSTYHWHLPGLMSEQDVTFDVNLPNMLANETRPAAGAAYLQFKNSFTGELLTSNLDIPQVKAVSGLGLTVGTDLPQYPANANVILSGNAGNTGVPATNAQVQILLTGADGTLVATLPAITGLQIPANSELPYTAQWNTGAYLPGTYTVTAKILDDASTVANQAVTSFAITNSSAGGTGSGEASLRTSTDRIVYNTTDAVNIADLAQSITDNSVLSLVHLHVTVNDPNGQIIGTYDHDLGQLAPGAIDNLPDVFTLNRGLQGQYHVAGALTDSTGATLATGAASFTVAENLARTLIGQISVQSAGVYEGNPETCTDTLINNGTQIVSNEPVQELVVSLGNQVAIASVPLAANLAVNQQQQGTQTVDTTPLAVGDYACVLQAQVNGAWSTLGYATFHVTDPTAALTGTLTATPNQVPLTTTVALTGTVSDGGNASVPGVNATLTIRDPAGNAVLTSPVGLGTLAVGQTSQLVANWMAAGNVGDIYTATLTVTVGPKSRALAQASFTLLPPPIKIAAGLAEGNHGRVLILTDDPAAYPGNQDPFGPNPAPDLAAQNQHLGAVLKAAGWSYTLVTNADDFATQFNTGGYEVYVMLSEAVKLPTALQVSLDQAVANGAGLIVAGNHDDRNNKLEDALGVHSTGKSLSATGIVLSASALEASGGQASFGIDGQPLSVNKASASVLGSFNLSGGGSAPAVFSNAYGTGKAVYMAFDLALEAAQTPGSFLDQLLTDTLGYVHPASLTPYTGRVIPLTLTVQNQGIATPAVATLTLPAGVSVIDPNGATVSGSSLSWTLSLTVGQTVTETAWIKLPATAGSISVIGEVDSGVPPALTSQATPSLLIGVQTKP